MLLIGIVLPVTGLSLIEKTTSFNTSGITRYVGGSGTGNYTKIQDAINDSVDGDTVYVYSGMYYENLFVDRSVNLLGENKDTTFIDGKDIGDVISVSANFVNINSFTIQNGYYGIWIYANNSIIIDNYISNNENGILLSYYLAQYLTKNNIVTNNTITNNREYGILIFGSNNNYINNNTVKNNYLTGIGIGASNNNSITSNIISNNDNGMFFNGGINNIITDNIISNNNRSILLISGSDNNMIYHNNFIKNIWNALDNADNIWDDGKYGNYWSNYKERYPFAIRNLLKPWMWNTPYEIDGGSNKDNCPLVDEWTYPISKLQQENKVSSNSFIIGFLEQFPILQRILLLLGFQ